MGDDWTLSASKIKKHERCPKSFEIEYLRGHRNTLAENRYIRRGNVVHDTSEQAFDAISEFEQATVASWLKYNVEQHDDWDLLVEEDQQHVLSCMDTASRFLAEHDPVVRGVEVEVEYGVRGVDRAFGGFIDVATDAEVWDWKTGKSKDKEADEAVQGAVYMGGYAHEYGEPPEAIRFIYLAESKVRTIEPDDDLWAPMIERAQALLTAVESGEFHADPGPSKCHFCDAEPWCPASPVGGGNIEWSTYP